VRPRSERILDYREYPVLYVDDDPDLLRIFELTFRQEFSVLTAGSAEEALERLGNTRAAVVLADQRMPGMQGVELLARVHELDENALRILVTAYSDAETLRQALGTGAIDRLVGKPWTPEEMRGVLRRGLEAYALDREREQLLRELTLLHRASRAMTQELALGPLLDLILATVVDELGYDAASLLLLDAAEERLRWERFAPREDAVADAIRALDLSRQSAPGFLFRVCDGDSQLLALDHALALEGVVRRLVTEISAEEILVVPLVGARRTLGAIAVDNRRGGRRFTADDQTLLEGIAAHAGVAIENARVVEELRRALEAAAPSAPDPSLDPRTPDC
jgi:FixJ family two-component response regulator